MPPRFLNFSLLDTLFFILNILGHDVYHDFGSDSGRLIDSMTALNMINNFLNLAQAGGTKSRSQTKVEYATPIRKSLIYPQNLNLNPIRIPLAMGPGQGQMLEQGRQKLSPTTLRRTRADDAVSRQTIPSARYQPSPITSKVDTHIMYNLNKAQDKAEKAKQEYLNKTEEERQKIKFDAELTYIVENIQIAYEFNAFNYLFLSGQSFRLYKNLDYSKLNVSVKIFNTYSVTRKMYLLLSLLDQTQDLIYGNKNILDRDINKLIYCNQVFISINNAIAKKYILENISSDEILVVDFRNFLHLNLLKNIIWEHANADLLQNKKQEMKDIKEEEGEEGEEDVWETDNEDDNEAEDKNITDMKRRKISGGASDLNLNIQQTQLLLIDFTNELARTEKNQIFNTLRDRDFSQSTKVSSKSNLKAILGKNRQYKTIEILEKVIDDVIQAFKKNTLLDNVEKINMLNNAYKVFITRKITEYTEKIADMIAEQEAARAAREAVAAEQAARAAERVAIQAAREEQGKPGPKHLSIRNDFMETIIKIVLVNCGIYQFNGDPTLSDLDVQMNPKYINMNNDENDFTKELGILIAKSPFSYPQGWQRVSGVPDDVLFEHFKDSPDIKQINPPPRSTLSYIVNNAALIGQHGLDGNYFCPISSILDGQSTCGYDTNAPTSASKGSRSLERGDMDFKIQGTINAPNDLYYNGKSNQNSNNQGQYTYQINLGFPGSAQPIQLNKPMELGGDDLTAQKALKNTLVSMIDYYNLKQQQQQFQLDPSIGFFDNLYRRFLKTDINFTTNMYQILFKGSGDLFQEINAVCKNGGYVTMPTYYPGSDIAQFNNTGDILRAFYANDRPSACRAFKFLRDGNPNEINQNAFGGYVGKDDESYLYFKKQANKYVVTGGKVKTSKSNKTKKRHQKSIAKKQIMSKTKSRKQVKAR
jgi:hypothetical protein